MAAPIKYEYDYILNLGFEDFKWVDKHYCEFICSNCKEKHKVTRGAFITWYKKGLKFCSLCRKSSGALKPASYYQKLVPEQYKVLKVIREAGNTKVELLHEPCNTIQVYSSRHLLARETSELYCKFCNGLEGFDSLIEKELVNYTLETFPELDIEIHKPYSDIFKTDRLFISDIYIKSLNIIIEITSASNNLPNYFETAKLKETLAVNNGINWSIVTSKQHIYDIVKALLKSKEKA